MKVKTFLSIACLSLMLVGCGNDTVDNSGKIIRFRKSNTRNLKKIRVRS